MAEHFEYAGCRRDSGPPTLLRAMLVEASHQMLEPPNPARVGGFSLSSCRALLGIADAYLPERVDPGALAHTDRSDVHGRGFARAGDHLGQGVDAFRVLRDGGVAQLTRVPSPVANMVSSSSAVTSKRTSSATSRISLVTRAVRWWWI